jgi:hypothetical protein
MIVMDKLKMIPSRVRRLLAAKLGRCPFCMRASARGTVASWAAVLTLAFTWPNPVALAVASVITFGFTLLMVSHLITYMIRVGLTLRAVQEEERPARMPSVDHQGRRTFMVSVGKAGVAALLISLFGRRVAVWAQMAPCSGEGVLHTDEDGEVKVGRLICSGTCPGEAECERQSVGKKKGGEEQFCACKGQPEPTECHLVKVIPAEGAPSFECRGTCPQGSRCQQRIVPFFGRFLVRCECI